MADKGFQLTQQDGQTSITLDTDQLDTLARVRNGQATGMVAHKFAFTSTQKEADAGLTPRMVTEDGQVLLVRKVSVIYETQTAEKAASQAEAKWGRGIIASLRKRTGLTKGKVQVTDSERISLAELQEWIDGDRTIDYRTFDALPEETQRKVIQVRDELATGKPPAKARVSAAAQMAALWDIGAYSQMLAGGVIDQAAYDVAEASVKAYKAQMAAQAAKKAAPALIVEEGAELTEQGQD